MAPTQTFTLTFFLPGYDSYHSLYTHWKILEVFTSRRVPEFCLKDFLPFSHHNSFMNMKAGALSLTVYIFLLLLEPSYLHLINLSCNSCAAATSYSKKSQSSCHSSAGCSQKQNSHKPVNYQQPHFTITCNSCNPFLICSGNGFIFSSQLDQHSLTPQQNIVTLSANESLSFLFIHELLQPPEYTWFVVPK